MPDVQKLGPEFVLNRQNPYNLPEGTLVFSAKFGHTQVDIWRDLEPGPIWRGTPKQIVGTFGEPLWQIVVRGELSSCAMTEEAAKARGERYALDSQANHRSGSARPKFRYALSEHEMLKHDQDFQAMLDATMRKFPEDFDPSSPPAAASPISNWPGM